MKRGYAARRLMHGVVSLEYALLLLLGILPLILATFSGVLIFAAQQSLSLAAAEGARASLRYGTMAQRRTAACMAARESMDWLLEYARQSPDCANAAASPIAVSQPFACVGSADRQCMRVTVSYDYDHHPFIPGTGRLYGWTIGTPLSSVATAQLDLGE
jgi:hypothetical protein